MSNSNKENYLIEGLDALSSTERAISDNYINDEKTKDNKSSKKFDFFNLEKLNSKVIL